MCFLFFLPTESKEEYFIDDDEGIVRVHDELPFNTDNTTIFY
jgi:hypothetical protein